MTILSWPLRSLPVPAILSLVIETCWFWKNPSGLRSSLLPLYFTCGDFIVEKKRFPLIGNQNVGADMIRVQGCGIISCKARKSCRSWLFTVGLLNSRS